ncbi:glycine-rich domain-containing protein [Chryseobacterium profundimaris]|uniref:TIGR04222 domain-containing membrane protein n=1 Tax=Chryseobacterium profundimaris TaxID=1387275 RepID=A0ABY1NA85_9FLAO|nr:hypothetical protein [Chryseobacterium profundimaris]SMP04361.1 hypothetical protein SAMN06264346_101305 [Chryseobacterium profundimaris]
METKLILQNDPLWKRLQNFSLDHPNAHFPFSKKLAKGENWTSSFTEKAIEEYKKFVYLCCTLPDGASPSEIVDKVWHMHLIYTQNYWEEFCPHILQKKLHHHPSQGCPPENGKHKNWFNETLKSYREIFQQEPPEEIWKLDSKALNKQNRSYFGKIVLLLSCVFMIYSCFENNNAGLGIFFTIIFSFVIIVLIIKSFSKNNESNKNNTDTGSDGTFFYTCGSDSSHGDGGSSGCGGGCGGCGGGD